MAALSFVIVAIRWSRRLIAALARQAETPAIPCGPIPQQPPMTRAPAS